MPELPEVETVRRGLLKALPGKKVTGATVLRPDSIGYPDPDQFSRAVSGHKFVDIERRGKYILFRLDKGASLVAHLRMSGRLLIAGHSKARAEHIRVRLQLDTGEELIFEDMRVFGRLWYVPKAAQITAVVSGLKDLGVEPLESEFTPQYLRNAFAKRTQPIKSALLDQTVIAGIGNIYADEALHLSGIHPKRPARDLSLPELTILCRQVKTVLERAIKMRGSSLRNYTDSNGVNGNYQNRAHVYGREGEPCRQCGSEIERIKLSGRSSHYCPSCQPSGKRRAPRAPRS